MHISLIIPKTQYGVFQILCNTDLFNNLTHFEFVKFTWEWVEINVYYGTTITDMWLLICDINLLRDKCFRLKDVVRKYFYRLLFYIWGLFNQTKTDHEKSKISNKNWLHPSENIEFFTAVIFFHWYKLHVGRLQIEWWSVEKSTMDTRRYSPSATSRL